MARVLNPEATEFRAVGCGWAGGSAGEGAKQPEMLGLPYAGWWFQLFFYVHPENWGRFPF